ncbi:MAG: hydroxyacid dehydrogenase [Verrucomicrobia bacterium 61-8]|nr:NADH-quinone oxidoreductase subunit H [Verrucomicrobiota bacterium]OJU97660.1 MAG: hydroxyacid dehydrogenase [Verrucomicrobia bacterium 61-8]
MQPEVFLAWTSIIKTLVIVFGIVLPIVSLTVFAERKVCAFIQDRVGPNRVGLPTTILGFKKDIRLLGLGQMIADPIKLLLKENFIPNSVNKFYYYIAPKLAMIPALLVLAVLPFGPTVFFGDIKVPLMVANIDIGILWVFAISSLGVYGIVLAGWASNSKYPFLGGIRSSSQMISYELSLGLSVIPVFLIVGTLNMQEIVVWQRENGWMVAPFWPKGFSLEQLLHGDFSAIGASFVAGFSVQRLLIWVPMLVSFIIFLIAMFAETNRVPFDLPEAEQELVGGYHTEYSSMGFALFFLGEYAAMAAGSGVIVTLFLGGWSLPFIPDGSATSFFGLPFIPAWGASLIWGLVGVGIFLAKIAAMLFLFIWVRWTLPRFRYDQLMKLGWYFFFELALVNIFLTALILALVKF